MLVNESYPCLLVQSNPDTLEAVISPNSKTNEKRSSILDQLVIHLRLSIYLSILQLSYLVKLEDCLAVILPHGVSSWEVRG